MLYQQKPNWFNYALTFLALLVFVPLLIILIPIVLFNDLAFGTFKGWNYNYRFFAKTFEVLYFFIGIRRQQMYAFNHNISKQYIFVSNHISYFDIPELLIGIKQPVRVLAKKGPDKIPIFGYYYRKSVVMVDRSSNESRAKSMQQLKDYLNHGVSIMLFPEGTFNMTNKPLIPFYDGAFKLAIEMQVNIKPFIILDTFNTLNYDGIAIKNGKSKLVYLQEVNVQGLTINDVQALKEKVYKIMEDAIIKFKAPWLH